MYRGPDAIRGSGHAFIYSAYPDEGGNRLFVEPGHVGHETMISDPRLIMAMLGPRYDSLQDVIVSRVPVWDAEGKDTGETRTSYDYMEIRMLTRDTSLYGRCGHLEGHRVVMLWQFVEGWQEMLDVVLPGMGISEDAIVTVGTSEQFLVKDYAFNRIASNFSAEAIGRYHVATWQEKQSLAKICGLVKYVPNYPDVSKWTEEDLSSYRWRRRHWRIAAKRAGIKGVFEYWGTELH